jgi:predicted ester cyclase
MSVEANEEAVRTHIDLSWNRAEFDALAEVWSLDAVVHLWDGNDLNGLDALKEHLRIAVLAWSERHCEIEALVGQGNLVANRWSFRASDPTGARWVTSGMDFYRFEARRIVEEWIALGNATIETTS